MVVYYPAVKESHQAVERQCRSALEKGVGLALLSHSEYDVVALVVFIHHKTDGINVILQVGIDAYGSVTVCRSPLQSCPQGILMTTVARQLQAANLRCLLGERLDNAPCLILASVVYI